MTRWLIALAAGVVLGLATHIATLLAVPVLAPDAVFARLAGLGPDNVFVPLAADEHATPRVPFLDPAFRYRVCRFDLSEGPLRIRAPIGAAAYTALSFYTPGGLPFFSINDRSATDGALAVTLTSRTEPAPPEAPGEQEATIAAPVDSGLIVLSALTPTPGEAAAIDTVLAGATCDVDRAPPASPAPAPG